MQLFPVCAPFSKYPADLFAAKHLQRGIQTAGKRSVLRAEMIAVFMRKQKGADFSRTDTGKQFVPNVTRSTRAISSLGATI